MLGTCFRFTEFKALEIEGSEEVAQKRVDTGFPLWRPKDEYRWGYCYRKYLRATASASVLPIIVELGDEAMSRVPWHLAKRSSSSIPCLPIARKQCVPASILLH